MIRIGDNNYRNLEEQVLKNKQDIAEHYNIDRVLANTDGSNNYLFTLNKL